MAEKEQKGGNALVAGVVLAGVAVTAAVLSKKENRDKAKKIAATAIRNGKKIMERPEAKMIAGVVAKKAIEKVKEEYIDKAKEPKQLENKEN